jgi:hypothetical protein
LLFELLLILLPEFSAILLSGLLEIVIVDSKEFRGSCVGHSFGGVKGFTGAVSSFRTGRRLKKNHSRWYDLMIDKSKFRKNITKAFIMPPAKLTKRKLINLFKENRKSTRQIPGLISVKVDFANYLLDLGLTALVLQSEVLPSLSLLFSSIQEPSSPFLFPSAQETTRAFLFFWQFARVNASS